MCSRRGLEVRDVTVIVAHPAADLIDVYILDAWKADGCGGAELKNNPCKELRSLALNADLSNVTSNIIFL